MEKNERTKEMMKNFLSHRKEGKTVKEIAEIYNLTTRIIYMRLQEIADANGVSREDLLDRIHKPYELTAINGRKPLERADAEKLANHFSSMIEETDKIISVLDNILKENKAFMEDL